MIQAGRAMAKALYKNAFDGKAGKSRQKKGLDTPVFYFVNVFG